MQVNLSQVFVHLLQVLFVGMTLGSTRTVLPALAESEFDLPRGSFLLIVALLVALGFVKGAKSFIAA